MNQTNNIGDLGAQTLGNHMRLLSLRGGRNFPSEAGFDAGTRSTGNTFSPSGIPTKPRHRLFLGIKGPQLGY